MKRLTLLLTSMLSLHYIGCVDIDDAMASDYEGGVYELEYSHTNDEALSSTSQNTLEDLSYPGKENFSEFELASFVATSLDNQSTFGLDVDAGSYTFARGRVLDYDQLPDSNQVRTEEFLNFFEYNYPSPTNSTFNIIADHAMSPYRDSKQILRVGLQAKAPSEDRIPWNLTFLIDVSGSMTGRLNLVKQSLYILVDNMREGDFISITTYAGKVSTVLEPISLRDADRKTIKGMISDLTAGGGTAMGDGMTNAYQVNKANFLMSGINRVIVCSDGDANIGAVGGDALLQQIQSYVDEGILMSTIGYGIGNYQDATMEKLANSGNGNYYYIDNLNEAERIFKDKLISTIEVVAIDAKIQVEFDSTQVFAYRLLGYENRDIADELFEVDTTDAGEIGAGHTVTALYELILHENASSGKDLGTIRIRYKDLKSNSHEESSVIAFDGANVMMHDRDKDFQFAALVGEYADILRKTPHSQTTLSELWDMAQSWKLDDDELRKEFYQILEKAKGLK